MKDISGGGSNGQDFRHIRFLFEHGVLVEGVCRTNVEVLTGKSNVLRCDVLLVYCRVARVKWELWI